jgi:tetratricopeptide (TPR) repeat protein
MVRQILLTLLISAGAFAAQAPSRQEQPEFVKQGQALARDGKLEEALELYRKTLKDAPNSQAANNGAGVVLDLMGKGMEARKYFAKAIEVAQTPQSKAAAQRAMAMSYAFESDCKKTVEYEQMVFDYYASVKDFFQQGETANEAARVCIDSGDLDTAYKWYQTGHDSGLREPNIKPDRLDLWEFRWEHAQARIAARRGNKAEAEKHVAVAKAALDRGRNPQQAPFFPHLVGYVAFYEGNFKGALEELQKANQNDPFIQCLIAQTYEKLGEKIKHGVLPQSVHNNGTQSAGVRAAVREENCPKIIAKSSELRLSCSSCSRSTHGSAAEWGVPHCTLGERRSFRVRWRRRSRFRVRGRRDYAEIVRRREEDRVSGRFLIARTMSRQVE